MKPAPTRTEPVTLTLPANASMVRVGRLTASSVASLAELSIDDIDDIKIAVSETITLLLQHGDKTAIRLRFETGPGTFSLEGSTSSTAKSLGRDDAALTAAVLDAVCDRHEVAFVDGTIMVRLEKHASHPISAS